MGSVGLGVEVEGVKHVCSLEVEDVRIGVDGGLVEPGGGDAAVLAP